MARKLLTTEQIRDYLMEKNAHVFENPLAPEAHDVIVTGKMLKKGDDWVPRFIQKSVPNEAAKNVGIEAGRYIRASVKKHVDLTSGFRGSKKPVAANIFESAQPEMFLYYRDLIMEGGTNFKELNQGRGVDKPTKADLPIIKMNVPVYGKIVTILVPNYKPQVTDENGNRKALEAGRYNHYTKSYEKDEVTMDTLTFFADEDDLERLMSVATKLFQSQVEPYAVGDVIESTVIGNKVVDEKIKDNKPIQDANDQPGPKDDDNTNDDDVV